MDDYELIDNEERHQYEFHIGKYVPKIEYIKTKNGDIPYTHRSARSPRRERCRQPTG